MLNVTLLHSIEILHTVWAYTNQYLPPLDATEIFHKLRANLNDITASSDFMVLLIIFILAYFLWVITRTLFSWVWGMVKFAFWVGVLVFIYWLYVSIDVERGNEQVRDATKNIVSGVKDVMQDVMRDVVDRGL